MAVTRWKDGPKATTCQPAKERTRCMYMKKRRASADGRARGGPESKEEEGRSHLVAQPIARPEAVYA